MSKPLTCMVVDDEPWAMELIADYVLQTPALQLVHKTTDPVEALQWVFDKKVQVVFIDIQMRELTGLNFSKLAKGNCVIVFITAYDKYALEGYEHDAIDYLVKPVTFETFMRVIPKITRRFNEEIKTDEQQAVDYIFVKSEHKTVKLFYDEIIYFEALRDYVAIHTPKTKVLTLQSLTSFIEKLPSEKFLRIHKSYIISIRKIEFFEKNKVLIGGEYLPIGETYREQVYQALGIG